MKVLQFNEDHIDSVLFWMSITVTGEGVVAVIPTSLSFRHPPRVFFCESPKRADSDGKDFENDWSTTLLEFSDPKLEESGQGEVHRRRCPGALIALSLSLSVSLSLSLSLSHSRLREI